MKPLTLSSVGFGLRENHIQDFFDQSIDVDLFEVIAENYTIQNGLEKEKLITIAKSLPMHLHGVSLNIGGFDPLDLKHLKSLKQLANQTDSFLISDHLCWNKSAGRNTFELMPLPFTKEAINHVSQRILKVQDILGSNIALENVTSYFRFQADEMSEIEFINEIVQQTNIKILFDVNNLFINGFNHNFNPYDEINKLNPNDISVYHLAGHSDFNTFKFDGHDSQVQPQVWNLYQYCIQKIGPRPTIIERDENIPASSELAKESLLAKNIMQNTSVNFQNDEVHKKSIQKIIGE